MNQFSGICSIRVIISHQKNKQVSIDIVDIPGNERLRERTWRQYIDTLL